MDVAKQVVFNYLQFYILLTLTPLMTIESFEGNARTGRTMPLYIARGECVYNEQEARDYACVVELSKRLGLLCNFFGIEYKRCSTYKIKNCKQVSQVDQGICVVDTYNQLFCLTSLGRFSLPFLIFPKKDDPQRDQKSKTIHKCLYQFMGSLPIAHESPRDKKIYYVLSADGASEDFPLLEYKQRSSFLREGDDIMCFYEGNLHPLWGVKLLQLSQAHRMEKLIGR